VNQDLVTLLSKLNTKDREICLFSLFNNLIIKRIDKIKEICYDNFNLKYLIATLCSLSADLKFNLTHGSLRNLEKGERYETNLPT